MEASEAHVCTDCGGKLVYHNGEYVCRVCGLVVGASVEESNYGFSAPSPFNLYFSLTKDMRDWKGKMRRLRKYEQFSVWGMKGKLNRYSTMIRKVCRRLNLPNSIYERGVYIMSKLIKEHDKVSTAYCLLALLKAIRERGQPISLRELRKVFEEVVGFKIKGIRTAMRHVKLPRPNMKLLLYKSVIRTVSDEKLIMPIYRRAFSLYLLLTESPKFTHKQRRTLAAAIVYLACKYNGLKISQRRMAMMNNVSEWTIDSLPKQIRSFIRERGMSLEEVLNAR